MELAYVESDKISVFPLAKNRGGSSNSRALSEDRIANIIRQVIDTKGFILSDSVSWNLGEEYSLNKDFHFNLGGYFISLSEGAVLPGNTVWASIKIVGDEIDGQDSNGQYQGVNFSTEPLSDDSSFTYQLQLFDNGEVVKDSKVKFRSSSLSSPEITVIDGKHS